MANKLEIVISATDHATAVMRRINQSLDKFTAPVRRLRTTMSSFGQASGVTQLAKRLQGVAKSAITVTKKLLGMAGPLAAIVGGGTIAGLIEMVTQWSRWGWEVERTSQTLGVTTDQLQSLRGAANLAGVSSDTLTGGLKTLGDTMEDALYGRNQQALAMLSRLGIGIHRARDGTIDTTRAFYDLSRAIVNIKSPQVQGLVARSFGLEGALPMLRQGPAAIRAYQSQMQALGAVQSPGQLDAAARFGVSLEYLKGAATGARNAIATKLVPALTPLVEQLTAWLSQNREIIATKFTDFILSLVDGVTKFVKWVAEVVDWLGGWKQALKDVGYLIGVSLVADILLVIGKLGALVFMWRSVATAAATAADAQAAATAAAAGAPAAATAGGGMLASSGWLAGLLGRIGLPAYMLLHSEDLNAGEDDWAAKNRAYLMSHKTAPVGIRNNNPMNLRRWGNAPVVDGFAKFSSMHEGLVADVKNLIYGQTKHRLGTLDQLISRWAPRSDNNATDGYINAVQRDTGLSRYQQLNLLDPATLQSLVPAMIKQEVGAGHVSSAEISAAIGDALKTIKVEVNGKGMPAGMDVSAQYGETQLPTRVDYSQLLGVHP